MCYIIAMYEFDGNELKKVSIFLQQVSNIPTMYRFVTLTNTI